MKKIIYFILFILLLNLNLFANPCDTILDLLEFCNNNATKLGCVNVEKILNIEYNNLVSKEEKSEFNLYKSICLDLCNKKITLRESKEVLKNYLENCKNNKDYDNFLSKKYNLKIDNSETLDILLNQ